MRSIVDEALSWVTAADREQDPLRLVSYMCELAIHMVDTSHSTRLARLGLAHRSGHGGVVIEPDA